MDALIILSSAEIRQLTGYKRPGDQLAELRRQGFLRARRSRVTGEVILERAHYDAVCSGHLVQPLTARPQVRPPRNGQRPQVLRAVT